MLMVDAPEAENICFDVTAMDHIFAGCASTIVWVWRYCLDYLVLDWCEPALGHACIP